MKLTKQDLHQKKITLIGMQGSGKTFRSKQLIKGFQKPLIYGVYPFEWEDASDKVEIFIPKDYTMQTFENFAGQLIKQQEKNKTYDCLFIDDADLFFTTNFAQYPNTNRLFISMRQLGLTLIFASKRPQNLSTKVYENSDLSFIFAIEGINVKRYLENLHKDMKILLPQLSREKHNCIFKKVGEDPKILGKKN
jgi:hypothetical protein